MMAAINEDNLFAVIIKGSLGLLAVLTVGGFGPVFRHSGPGGSGRRQHRDCKLSLDAQRAAAHIWDCCLPMRSATH